MDLKKRFQRWFQFRFAINYPFGIFLALFANSDDKSIVKSIGFIIIGLLIRLWANGYAIKMDKLTTSGPFAFVRNPLYLGTMFLAVGFVIMFKIYYVGALFLIVMAIGYYRTIKKEEKMLAEKFKYEYLDYKSKVPAMVPTIFPYRKGEKWPFSFKRLIKSKEYKTLLWVSIIIILFHVKSEFFVEHEKFNPRILGFLVTAFLLAAIDLIGEAVKYKAKSSK